jgi:hypothetical protein
MFRIVITLAVLALLVPSVATAASPSLGGLTPRGGQRGTDIEVLFNGARLEDAQEILFYEPGISLVKLEAVNTNQVKATLKIAPDCQLGAHRVRVRTATGISDLHPFMVGNLPIVPEVEPNSDFAKPQVVAMNSTVIGVADNEDVDYYVIDAKKGDRITAEVEAIRLGISLFDVYVAILNSARFELSASDDNALVWQDGIASIIAPEDGKYIIQVRESSYGGNGGCQYRVHIGNFPRPQATLPAGGKIGEQVTLKLLGDVAGDRDQAVTLPGSPLDKFAAFAQDDKGVAPSPNWLRVSEYGNVLEAEPNETHDTATKFEAPMALNGVLTQPGDTDNFRFTAKQGQVFDVRVHARSIRSPLDPVLTILAAGGGALAGNDDSAGPDSFIRFTAPSNGDFIINVGDHLKNGGPTYAYRVELTPIKPAVKLTVAEFVQYVQPTASVPKGNRCALMINASRIDCGGVISIKGLDLPPGMTIETFPMPANMTSVPVIFVAAADAPVGGKLADIVGVLEDAEKKPVLEGHLQQDVVLIRGQNQTPFWTESVSRLATAVTNEAPFSIEIVEPKVPLVHDGQMTLKVIAKRKEGFTAPIKIDMLWLPPGLNASREVSIPEKVNEAVIPMNAAGNAQVGDWKIAIRASATVGNGPIEVCSPFANLKIAERYLTFAYEQSAVEQGKETELVVKVTKAKDYEGPAKVTLIGLPNKAVTEPMDVTKDKAELIFKIKTEKDTPAGNHQNLFCQVIIMENGEPILHVLGGGKLRVDVPLPPKKDAPPPMPAPMPVAAPVAVAAPPMPPPMKRLTRLEQLRLEQAEREKAAKGGM